jgi:hypothetical protein
MKIYTPHVTNDHLSILPRSDQEGLAVKSVLNTKPLFDGWNAIAFEFKAFHKSGKEKPDITTIGGGLAFRSELKDLIFPAPCPELEFLPITVSGDKWTVTNCLTTTNYYDRENSILYRRGSGQIFMIKRILVKDPNLAQCEMFVVEDSNRTALLMLPTLVDRIIGLGVAGIEFKEIGVIENC